MIQVEKVVGSMAIMFRAESDAFIDENHARVAQARAGYDPRGYGFYYFKCRKVDGGGYVATWQCGASAD